MLSFRKISSLSHRAVVQYRVSEKSNIRSSAQSSVDSSVEWQNTATIWIATHMTNCANSERNTWNIVTRTANASIFNRATNGLTKIGSDVNFGIGNYLEDIRIFYNHYYLYILESHLINKRFMSLKCISIDEI